VIGLDPVDGGVEFDLKVVPGSSRERIVGEYDRRLKIAVTLPPEGGKANQAVVRLLADRLGKPRRDIEIVAGHGSPRKRVRIVATTVDEMRSRLKPWEDSR